MIKIPLYSTINDLHQLTGSPLRTSNPLFHCFDMSLTNNLSVTELPPHRVDFYTLALNTETQNLDYTLNNTTFHNPKNFLLCVAPGQVATWQKKGDWFGYCTFFKAGFLQFNSSVNFLQQYPFFNISETNLLSLNKTQLADMAVYFQQILAEQQSNSSFSTEIIRAAFQAILWQTRRMYEEQKQIMPAQKANDIITAQFQFLVNTHFLEKIAVEEYAQLLNITANHLSQTIKNTTGKTAKSFITKRRIDEAMYVLQYTNNDIATIAFHLNFTEPTHFTKFFKKETGMTPNEFRLHGR
jgi:AraC family transcriptional regulator, transcriptional activator of pobA